ncbi:MAG: class I SAM-dependent methyltransferase [Candidatus Saganbacteria bacterium]|nr:class I SAM-dependent methyltransferase [Candidatus Saganbacteria bacterium]
MKGNSLPRITPAPSAYRDLMRDVFERTRSLPSGRSPFKRFYSGQPVGNNHTPVSIGMDMFLRTLLAPRLIDAKRLLTAFDFYNAFANDEAREFTQRTRIENYTNGIMFHHPDSQSLDRAEIKLKCEELIDTIFGVLKEARDVPQIFYELIEMLSRGSGRFDALYFAELQVAYDHYKHVYKLPQREIQLSPYLVGSSLVDIGCGGGDLVAYLKEHHPELAEVAGIDVTDWRTPGLDIDYHVLDLTNPYARIDKQYDVGLMMAILHHAGRRDSEMDTFLQGARKIVRKRLIVEEDLIVSPGCLESGLPGVARFNELRETRPLLDEYLGYSLETQHDITLLNDYLANALLVGVPEMNFSFGFRTLTEWVQTFERNGFRLRHVNVLGFQSWQLHQVCHAHFILDKV